MLVITGLDPWNRTIRIKNSQSLRDCDDGAGHPMLESGQFGADSCHEVMIDWRASLLPSGLVRAVLLTGFASGMR